MKKYQNKNRVRLGKWNFYQMGHTQLKPLFVQRKFRTNHGTIDYLTFDEEATGAVTKVVHKCHLPACQACLFGKHTWRSWQANELAIMYVNCPVRVVRSRSSQAVERETYQ
jgi:hypothetical protein